MRLFANLLGNAAQATPADGAVEARARRDGTNVVVTVSDDGRGSRRSIWRIWGSGSTGWTRHGRGRDGGTGLGLSICRGIVEAHGGTMEFASTPGVGTTVTVTLPAG